jgi:hypothetical protein
MNGPISAKKIYSAIFHTRGAPELFATLMQFFSVSEFYTSVRSFLYLPTRFRTD